MRIVRGFHHVPKTAKGAVVAIGNFDGLHLGHKQLIDTALAIAKQEKAPLAVLTFEPHPRRVFNPSLPMQRLLSFSEKARLLQEWGVEILYVIHFTKAFSKMTAEAFSKDLLAKAYGTKHVVTGEDFTFGQNRQGNSAFLKAHAGSFGFGYTAVPALMTGDRKFSSSTVRDLLNDGDTQGAAALLGRGFTVSGRVVRGDGRGRDLGFPTANIRMSRRFLPKFGIYAVRASIDDETYEGVASFGMRPMYRVETPLLEVYLFDMGAILYGRKMTVEFVAYLREEEDFRSDEALVKQIKKDVALARSLLAGKS